MIFETLTKISKAFATIFTAGSNQITNTITDWTTTKTAITTTTICKTSATTSDQKYEANGSIPHNKTAHCVMLTVSHGLFYRYKLVCNVTYIQLTVFTQTRVDDVYLWLELQLNIWHFREKYVPLVDNNRPTYTKDYKLANQAASWNSRLLFD